MDVRALAVRMAEKHNTRDPFRIVEEMGIIVVLAPLINMRGFQQRVERRNIIYINSELDKHQQCLVCAHELAHHLLHRGLNRIFMDRNTRFVTQRLENEASHFALELIYPDEELQDFLARPIEDAATYMGVSPQAARRRIETVQPTLWTSFE